MLQRALESCTCNPYGDPSCCAAQGIFTLNQSSQCYISNTVDEVVFGNLSTLPGANPIPATCYEDYVATEIPAILDPVYTYTTMNGVTMLPSGTVAIPVEAVDVKHGPEVRDRFGGQEFCFDWMVWELYSTFNSLQLNSTISIVKELRGANFNK